MALHTTMFSQIPPFDVHGDSSTLAQRWKRWLARFDNGCVAWGVTDPEQKKALLLDRAGEDLFELFHTLTLPTGKLCDDPYVQAIQALNNYFQPKQNMGYEIFQFRRTFQNEDESIDQFIVRLRKLAANCGFENKKTADSEIKHQIIRGGRNKTARRRALQGDISLEDLVKLTRSMEISEREARGIEDAEHLEIVHKVSRKPPLETVSSQRKDTSRRNRVSGVRCYFCAGKYPHNCSCPAKDKNCYYSHDRGHFIGCCPKLKNGNNLESKSEVKHVIDTDSDLDDEFSFKVQVFEKHGGKLPFVRLPVNNECCEFMLDSGASCNVLNRVAFQAIRDTVELRQTDRQVYVYGNQNGMSVLGVVSTKVDTGKQMVDVDFLVVDTDDCSILGYPTARHLGAAKTKALVREKVWFPGMDGQIENMIRNCYACQLNYDQKLKEPLKTSKIPNRCWSHLAADMYGPLPSGEYLIVVIDEYFRFPEVEITSSTSAASVIPKLERMFTSYGYPDNLKTDNGPPFNSREFRSYAAENGFKHQKVTPEYASANGLAENIMKSIGKVIRCSMVERKSWKSALRTFLLNYRDSPHPSTGKSPVELMFGRKLKSKIPSFIKSESDALVKQYHDRQMKKKTKFIMTRAKE